MRKVRVASLVLLGSAVATGVALGQPPPPLPPPPPPTQPGMPPPGGGPAPVQPGMPPAGPPMAPEPMPPGQPAPMPPPGPAPADDGSFGYSAEASASDEGFESSDQASDAAGSAEAATDWRATSMHVQNTIG